MKLLKGIALWLLQVIISGTVGGLVVWGAFTLAGK